MKGGKPSWKPFIVASAVIIAVGLVFYWRAFAVIRAGEKTGSVVRDLGRTEGPWAAFEDFVNRNLLGYGPEDAGTAEPEGDADPFD